LLALCGGGALLLSPAAQTGGSATSLAAIGLLGAGAGATVSPGLYIAGFSLPSVILGRVFALVELVRSVADFMLSPVLLKVARVSSHGQTLSTDGVEQALWVTLWIAIGALTACVTLYLIGTLELPRPDIRAWLTQQKLAIHSPPLAHRLRSLRVA
jgi:hypothetical protein